MIDEKTISTTIRMDRRILLSQLIAAKASIDALIYALMDDGEQVEIRSTEQEYKCEHRNKLNLSTMGGDGAIKWLCRDCGFEYPPQEG